MSININPNDHSHVIKISFTNHPVLHCLTNNPDKITVKHIKNAFNNSKLNVINKNMKIENNDICFSQDINNKPLEEDSLIDFEDNIAKINLVIKHKMGDKIYYIPSAPKQIKEYHYKKPTKNSFPIFIRHNNSILCHVANDTLVGEIMDFIFQKTNIPIRDQRLSSGRKEMYLDDTVESHDITYASTIHMSVKLRGGMFHITSGKNDYNPREAIYMSLDE